MPEPVEGTEVPDDQVRCPHCQTTRLKVLKKLDRIEKLYGNALMNRMRARRGDTIYHCVYCRLQFYDPRKPGGQSPAAQSSGREETSAEKSEPERPVTAAAPVLPSPLTPELKAVPVNGGHAAAPAAGTNLTPESGSEAP